MGCTLQQSGRWQWKIPHDGCSTAINLIAGGVAMKHGDMWGY